MTTDFTIEFSGESQEVDLNVLLTSLMNLGAAIQEIKTAVASADTKVDVKVKPFGEGSFLVYLAIHTPDLIPLLGSLFSRDALSVAENILSVFTNTLNLKSLLGSQPPKRTEVSSDGQTMTVEGATGQVLQVTADVFNLYIHNPKIDAHISKAFEAMMGEENVTGFKVTDAKKVTQTAIGRESFEEMSRPISTVPVEERKQMRANVWVQVTKLSFEEGVPWEVVYEGNKIVVKMSDPRFFARIEANERFAKGDSFRVNLQVAQRFDKSAQAFLNKKGAGAYEIIEVLEHKEADKQLLLDIPPV